MLWLVWKKVGKSHQGSIFACPLFFIRIPFFQQEIEASRSLLLEELPPVLALHLKRFIYNETSGGCQKLLKNIDFPIDLDISKDILSPNSRLVFSFFQILTIRRIDCVENGKIPAEVFSNSSWIYSAVKLIAKCPKGLVCCCFYRLLLQSYCNILQPVEGRGTLESKFFTQHQLGSGSTGHGYNISFLF